jgi:transketolase
MKDKTNWDNKRYKNKEEWAKYIKEYRAKNADKLRAYNREYNRKWRKENGYHNENNSKKKFPEKELARQILQRAVKTGKIIRGNCEVCGKPKGQGHHDDYFKPLEVKWFCPLHHREYEKKLSTR